ncbi:MAG TPA: hypothetical protein VGO62_17960 [Myxococcota bacterium]
MSDKHNDNNDNDNNDSNGNNGKKTMSDRQLDALLLAIGKDAKAAGAHVVDEVVGEHIHAFRGTAPLDAFAARYGFSLAEMALLEASLFPAEHASDERTAIACAQELALPPLKVLRLWKAVRAPVDVDQTTPALLLAARRTRDDG